VKEEGVKEEGVKEEGVKEEGVKEEGVKEEGVCVFPYTHTLPRRRIGRGGSGGSLPRKMGSMPTLGIELCHETPCLYECFYLLSDRNPQRARAGTQFGQTWHRTSAI
jgi:hypothetical protein